MVDFLPLQHLIQAAERHAPSLDVLHASMQGRKGEKFPMQKWAVSHSGGGGAVAMLGQGWGWVRPERDVWYRDHKIAG